MFAPTFPVIEKSISAELIGFVVTSIGDMSMKTTARWPLKLNRALEQLRIYVILFGLGVPVYPSSSFYFCFEKGQSCCVKLGNMHIYRVHNPSPNILIIGTPNILVIRARPRGCYRIPLLHMEPCTPLLLDRHWVYHLMSARRGILD